jgi:cell division protein FtsL
VINPNIYLALAFLLFVIFMVFYAIADYNKRNEMVELLEEISNYLRNIELELKKEK